jgi:hypothetical protein
MSHHYSGADFGFAHGDARLDLTDLYAFPKPDGVGKSILILNVHPSFGLDPREPTTPEPFTADAVYEFKIDTDANAVADIAYRVRFSPFAGGAQTATLRYVEGAQAAGTDDAGQIIVEGARVSLNRQAHVTEAGDYRFFAGWPHKRLGVCGLAGPARDTTGRSKRRRQSQWYSIAQSRSAACPSSIARLGGQMPRRCCSCTAFPHPRACI